ncbi:MAG: hypothetical protein LUE93_06825 [Bacteroides sp.]|nr:hypothetical protein [Bacteroides sp.]
MIKHILKNIWTSRTGNVWILLELFVVTIFLWFSVDYISTNVVNLHRPLGFDYENVYRLGMGKLDVESELYDPAPEHTSDILEDFSFIIQRLKEHPLVEDVCYTRHYPLFVWDNYAIGIEYDTLSAECYLRLVSPSFFKVFRVQTYSGRNPE